jgi:negative regulator of replication initiation
MPDQPKTVARTVRVDDELWAAVGAEAKDRGEDISAATRRMYRGYVTAGKRRRARR